MTSTGTFQSIRFCDHGNNLLGRKLLQKKNIATQTKCLPKSMAVWVFSCRKCLSLLLPLQDGRDAIYVRCEQVDYPLSTVAEFKEPQAFKWGIDCQRNSLSYLRERHHGDTSQTGVDPLACHHWAKGGDLRDEKDWKRIPSWLAGNRSPPTLTSSSQVALCNCFEALKLQGQVNEITGRSIQEAV